MTTSSPGQELTDPDDQTCKQNSTFSPLLCLSHHTLYAILMLHISLKTLTQSRLCAKLICFWYTANLSKVNTILFVYILPIWGCDLIWHVTGKGVLWLAESFGHDSWLSITIYVTIQTQHFLFTFYLFEGVT